MPGETIYHDFSNGGVPRGLDPASLFRWLLERRRALEDGDFELPRMPNRIRVVDENGHTTQVYADELNNLSGPTRCPAEVGPQ